MRVRESSFFLLASGVVRPAERFSEDGRKKQGQTQQTGNWIWRILFMLILAYGMYAGLLRFP